MGKAVAHIGSLVNYVFKEEKDAKLLYSEGLDTSSPKAILGDFEMIKNTRLKNQYLSMVISPAELQTGDDLFKDLLKDTLSELGLSDTQYIAVLHDNTEHKHLHILLNRTDYKGKTFNDSYIGLRAKKFSKELADKYQLESAYDKQGKRSKQQSLKNSKYHKDLEGSIQYTKSLLNEILKHPDLKSIDQIYDHFRSNGVDVNITQHTNKTYGVTLTHNDQKMKASQVSRLLSLKLKDDGGYTANNKLQKILDDNAKKKPTQRTQEEIIKDIAEQPENQVQLLQELRNLTIATRSGLNDKNNDDEDDHLKKNKRKSKKDKQKGMRIKY
jgi:hypothetical protein